MYLFSQFCFSRICVAIMELATSTFLPQILPPPSPLPPTPTPPDITTAQSPNFYPIQFNSQSIHPSQPSSSIHNNLGGPNPTSPPLSHRMRPPVVLILLHEHRFPSAIRRERNRSNAQTGESALEPVPAGEGASVAPCFPDVFASISFGRVEGARGKGTDARAQGSGRVGFFKRICGLKGGII